MTKSSLIEAIDKAAKSAASFVAAAKENASPPSFYASRIPKMVDYTKTPLVLNRQRAFTVEERNLLTTEQGANEILKGDYSRYTPNTFDNIVYSLPYNWSIQQRKEMVDTIQELVTKDSK